ncbi:MAG: acetaldehyde dehydrogenase (acetylating) [Elusimicrobiota bacterium]|jgi:acetaldehyde dehydrogenase (acetylating)|nr:acetaldehyde dehydrogenase (acetylating) [Elusimicrobiota bacterium]
MELDKDLLSVQEARNLISLAYKAQNLYKQYDQAAIDKVVKIVAEATEAEAVNLAKMANEETGFGKWEDKIIKNLFASKNVYQYIKDLKTIGVINDEYETRKVIEVGVPVGIVAGLIPSTNPTSTVIFKSLIALKAGCAIVFSPHPSAKNCISTAVTIIRAAISKAGASPDLVSVLPTPTKEATDTLMRHKDISLILATGGNAMVKAAYSSGNPAIGVGPGNGPSYIEKSADIPLAVKRIFDSKTFDNGTICASEQSIVTESCIRKEVMAEVQKQGGYFLPPGDFEKVEKLLMNSSGTMNAKLVGKSAEFIAKAAGISIPKGTRVILGEETRVGPKYPYSKEKLMPVLGFYVEENWQKACDRCIEILTAEGAGHTMSIHSKDDKIIREFGLKKPVSRLIVNSPATLAGIGASTNIVPSLTLGCGAVGKNATSDNISPLNLINIRRIAYGVKEIEDIRPKNLNAQSSSNSSGASSQFGISESEIEIIVNRIVKSIKENSRN